MKPEYTKARKRPGQCVNYINAPRWLEWEKRQLTSRYREMRSLPD